MNKQHLKVFRTANGGYLEQHTRTMRLTGRDPPPRDMWPVKEEAKLHSGLQSFHLRNSVCATQNNNWDSFSSCKLQ